MRHKFRMGSQFKHFDRSALLLVCQSLRLCTSLYRHPTVAAHLIAFIGNQKSLLFPTSTGRAHSHSNARNRMLYPVLKKMGVAQTGFHGFRRFRATHLRKQQAPESLIKSWLGRSAKSSVTDLYARPKRTENTANRSLNRWELSSRFPQLFLMFLNLQKVRLL